MQDGLATENWKLVLAYDGTEFHGWQVQPGLTTVQGVLARAIADMTGEAVLPQGSGRTDAGVHAEGQVASFALGVKLPEENMKKALNRILPESVRVMQAQKVDASFHARHSARGKTYAYRVLLCPEDGLPCPPTMARYWLPVRRSVDVAAMQEAAAMVVGEHDFASFAASDPDVSERESEIEPSTVREIFSSTWIRDGQKLIYTVRGSGFLHHMVRNLVGTFLDIGYGRMKAADVPGILAAKDRSKAGPTAPARGLWLVQVEY